MLNLPANSENKALEWYTWPCKRFQKRNNVMIDISREIHVPWGPSGPGIVDMGNELVLTIHSLSSGPLS